MSLEMRISKLRFSFMTMSLEKRGLFSFFPEGNRIRVIASRDEDNCALHRVYFKKGKCLQFPQSILSPT